MIDTEKMVRRILEDLQGRSGFEDFWDTVAAVDQDQIRFDLQCILEEELYRVDRTRVIRWPTPERYPEWPAERRWVMACGCKVNHCQTVNDLVERAKEIVNDYTEDEDGAVRLFDFVEQIADLDMADKVLPRCQKGCGLHTGPCADWNGEIGTQER